MEEVCGQRAGGLEHIIDRHHGPTVFMQSDFQLGAWRVQPQLNSVACDQRTIRLEPKMMEVLVCLANGSGDVVPKEQLVREVWRDTFVTDDVLIRCVSGLRRVFGDDAGKSTVIETIPKKGYRLLVPVTRASYHDPTRDRSGHEFVDSIAILPFENTDHHAELDYLSDGLTETIINNLSQLDRLRVLPRTMVFQYKGKTTDPAKIGRDLRVRLVLVGQMMQRGEGLTITAELIDAYNEAQIWGRTYDRTPEDIFSIQGEMAGEISDHLRLRLSDVMKRQLTKRRTDSRDAHHLFLKAVYWADKLTAEGFRKGFEFARQAIEADPAYADAYGCLAYLYAKVGFFDPLAPGDVFRKAKAAALKALEIDDSLAEAHATLAFVKFTFDWDFTQAQAESRRSVEMDPQLAFGYAVRSHLCLAQGQYDEAVAEAKVAVDLAPLSSPMGLCLATTHYFSRRYDAAIELLNKLRDADPSFPAAYRILSAAYARKGMNSEALGEAEKYVALTGRDMTSRGTLGAIHAIVGNHELARSLLREIEGEVSTHSSLAFRCATIHALLGERDLALGWLEKAYDGRATLLVYLSSNPDFDELRGDSRFRDLLCRIGLPS